MSGLHLNHKVHWTDLKELVTKYEDPGLELPTGDCGLIHITNKKVEIQVRRRQYLANLICTSSDCSISETKIFQKHLKHKINLDKLFFRIYAIKDNCDNKKYDQVQHFFHCFDSAIHEFADTERRKIKIKRKRTKDLESSEAYFQNAIELLKSKHPQLKSVQTMNDNGYYKCKLCALFPILIEANEIETLLGFSDEEILSVFTCHPTQAVGKNWDYICWSVSHVYFLTNLIAAFRLENKPDDWGDMNPNCRYFRGHLMYDCDAQTFLESSREYLTDGVYMKDFNAMKQLCKNCFHFLYITQMLGNEVGIDCINQRFPWH